MTTQEFMDELREISPHFEWALEPDTGIHADRRKWPRQLIRGVLRDGSQRGVAFEPMGAVCYIRTGEVLEPKAWAQAGDVLGLLPVRAAELFAAGKDATWAGEEGKREPVEYLQALRARLIESVGLGVPTSPATTLQK